MKMLFLVFALAVLVSPGFAQDGHLLGLDKPTDCVMTRIKSIHGRLEGASLRETGVAVEYENGAYGVQYQLGDNPDKDQPGYSDYWQQKTYEDNIVASRVGDPINFAWFRSRCSAPRAMDVGVSTRLSTCAITDGGISATANTCAGAPKRSGESRPAQTASAIAEIMARVNLCAGATARLTRRTPGRRR
jgi:hypothetical protein